EDIEAYEDKSKVTTNIFRTTFHPDYDYSTFVGSYKPVMNPILDASGNPTGKEDLVYEFVPQVFTNAYVRAWKSLADENLTTAEKQVYLIIEEINRGNCAQIFGDLFQLLDRKNGRSEFSIIPDAELRKHLAKEGLESNKLVLPENLHIYATMNTSDQSLFPMDSAFKRRWAMEYVPINLEQDTAKKFTFVVNKKEYSWVEFLGKVNPLIRKATDSEDKQMGEFFIKDNVSEEDFLNKVMFFIWNDVCKDLYSASRISPLYFMRSAAGEDKKDVFTFAELFGKGRFNEEDKTYTAPIDLLEGFITKYLELTPKAATQSE
ncbi:MAG: AAA family ATPase, partial [Bacteroidales bacterium]|nr:AAA family ATPase [Bacteroidales bacterium]